MFLFVFGKKHTAFILVHFDITSRINFCFKYFIKTDDQLLIIKRRLPDFDWSFPFIVKDGHTDSYVFTFYCRVNWLRKTYDWWIYVKLN